MAPLNASTVLGSTWSPSRSVRDYCRRKLPAGTGEATNHNLYIVSLLTALFLPITLITGIFGMNVGGVPWVDQDGGFAWVFAIMILTAVTSLVLLHWRRFF